MGAMVYNYVVICDHLHSRGAGMGINSTVFTVFGFGG